MSQNQLNFAIGVFESSGMYFVKVNCSQIIRLRKRFLYCFSFSIRTLLKALEGWFEVDLVVWWLGWCLVDWRVVLVELVLLLQDGILPPAHHFYDYATGQN